ETQLQIVGNTRFATEAQIRKDQAIASQQIDQGQKILVRPVHRQSVPAHDLSDMIEHPTQLDANRPTALVSIFRTNLSPIASLPNRKQQLNRKTIHDIEHTRRRQQLVGLMLMPFELFEKRCAFWQATKQRVVIPLEPAIERPKASALQSEQNPDSYHLTR